MALRIERVIHAVRPLLTEFGQPESVVIGAFGGFVESADRLGFRKSLVREVEIFREVGVGLGWAGGLFGGEVRFTLFRLHWRKFGIELKIIFFLILEEPKLTNNIIIY